MSLDHMKDPVWSKAKTIMGRDPALYRQDPYGNVMYYHSYGKFTEMGWNIDHIIARNNGGSDCLANLQAMNCRKNSSLGDTRVKKSRHSKRNK